MICLFAELSMGPSVCGASCSTPSCGLSGGFALLLGYSCNIHPLNIHVSISRCCQQICVFSQYYELHLHTACMLTLAVDWHIYHLKLWGSSTFAQILLPPILFHCLWAVHWKKKYTAMLLLFLSRSFHQDAAAAAEKKINVGVNDELDDIIEEEKGGQWQEWRKTSHQPAEAQPKQSKTKWPWKEGLCVCVVICFSLTKTKPLIWFWQHFRMSYLLDQYWKFIQHISR